MAAICCLHLLLFVLLDSSCIAGRKAQAWNPSYIISIRPKALRLSFSDRKWTPSISGLRHDDSKATTAKLQLKGDALSGSDENQGNDETVSTPSQPKRAVFKPEGTTTPYQWKIPPKGGNGVNPADNDVKFCKLLEKRFFIDKSDALYDLLRWKFDEEEGDFDQVCLHLVYPRRFAKTTLLDFMEALFSPVPKLGKHNLKQVKTIIASLKKGKELLQFGMRPVVSLDMISVLEVDGLLGHIEKRLGRAGLDEATVKELRTTSSDPRELLLNGVNMLNKKFQAEFNVETTTIVLIDEHDKPFRNNEINQNDRVLKAIIQLYGIGKEKDTGISLLVLCGLTRMVGTGLSQINNLVDVSQKSRFHGLCGISAHEFIESCSDELQKHVEKSYKGQTLASVLKDKFVEDWDGFRFGLDVDDLRLNPESPEGALFSPLDVWEVVQSLSKNSNTPSCRWINTMWAEFEFTSFADKYIKRKESGYIELYRNLQGGWVDTRDPRFAMKRADYLTLSENLHVKKVLFELGLLSVKEITVPKVASQNMVRLGAPNWMVTRNAMRLLVDEVKHGFTPSSLARFYLEDSAAGFGTILASAAKEVSNVYRGTGKDIFREFPFQDYLFMELLYRFPDQPEGSSKTYEIFFEKHLYKFDTEKDEAEGEAKSENLSESQYKTNSEKKKKTEKKKGRADIILSLLYANEFEVTFLIELKVRKIEEAGAESIAQAHASNIQDGSVQVETYKWPEPTIRIAVSGVWHPAQKAFETYLPYELNAQYKFLKQLN